MGCAEEGGRGVTGWVIKSVQQPMKTLYVLLFVSKSADARTISTVWLSRTVRTPSQPEMRVSVGLCKPSGILRDGAP